MKRSTELVPSKKEAQEAKAITMVVLQALRQVEKVYFSTCRGAAKVLNKLFR